MTTCRDIVSGALQLLGAYGGNETPSPADSQTGLDGLQSMYDGWVASGMFGTLTNVYAKTNYTANERELITAASGVTVALPTTMQPYGEDVRAPRDFALVEIRNASNAGVWLYDRGAWVKINALSLDDTAPLSSYGKRGLMACLAATISGDFNMQMTPSMARLGVQFRGMISNKLGSTQDPTPASYF